MKKNLAIGLSILSMISIFSFADNLEIEKVIRVYDGDTFYVDLGNCTASDMLCKNVPIRVLGIDTAEIHSKSEHEHTLALAAKKITSDFITTRKISLKNCNRDKYFRIDCEVYDDKGVKLEDVLLSDKLAVEYNGGTKTTDWSKF